MTLSLFAAITPKPEFHNNVRSSLEQILAPTLEEPGCLRFELHLGRDDDPKLYLVETWQDEEALQTHYAAPYITSVMGQYDEWLVEPPVVTKMTPFA